MAYSETEYNRKISTLTLNDVVWKSPCSPNKQRKEVAYPQYIDHRHDLPSWVALWYPSKRSEDLEHNEIHGQWRHPLRTFDWFLCLYFLLQTKWSYFGLEKFHFYSIQAFVFFKYNPCPFNRLNLKTILSFQNQTKGQAIKKKLK